MTLRKEMSKVLKYCICDTVSLTLPYKGHNLISSGGAAPQRGPVSRGGGEMRLLPGPGEAKHFTK